MTGGSGFIGRNLTEALKEDYLVFSPSHKELDILDHDALQSYIAKHGIDTVIHAAVHVPGVNGAEKEFFNDMQMFFNLEKLSENLDKVIYFGSGAEYDKRFHIRDVKEEEIGKHIPVTEYGLAKYAMNKIARASDNIYNLRLFGVFGKYEQWEIKFLSNLCCKAVYDLPLTIRKECRFNFLFIDDLIQVVRLALENDLAFHDYNVCYDESFFLSSFARMVLQVSGKDLEIRLLSHENNLDYTASNARLHSTFPDLRLTSMECAIEKLYEYYFEHKTLIDYETLKNTR